MSVFIRKFEPGGVAKLNEGSETRNENENQSSNSPKFNIGDYQINTNDFVNDLENNFQRFQNIYGGTWTNKEREDIIKNHQLFIQNVRHGNITGIDSNGRFDVVDPGFSGIDFSTDGAWGRYSYYVKQIADAEKIGTSTTTEKPKNKFTNTSILRDIHNNFFGGTENPDYQSFFDLDEVVEQDGKKVRGVQNRVNALLSLLNENYMSKYDDADEALGGLEGAKARVNRLRKALSDGTLNNEDYAAASALGLNLRGLLSTDGNISFNTNGGFQTSEEEQPASSIDQLREMAYGKQENPDELLAKINNWDKTINNTYNLGVNQNFRADDYLQQRMKARNEDSKFVSSYYRNQFFPKFFENLKTYTPEYLKQNPNMTVSTWQGNQKLQDYIRTNLTLAIRNKLYGGEAHSLLSDQVYNELNQIIGTNFWTVPGSFNEETGTILLFNPDSGDYKRVSINNEKLKFESPVDKKPHALLQDYLYGKGVTSAKKGAKLQLGGNINALLQNQLTEDQRDQAFADRMTSYTGSSNSERLSGGHTTIEKEEGDEGTHANDTIIGKDSKSWETEDYARLTSLGADLVSLAGGYVGLGAGLASTLSDVVGDLADESLTGWDVIKNAGINTAWTVAGVVPGAKLGKIGKALLKWGPRGLALLNSAGLIKDDNTYKALHRMFTKGEVTSADLNILTQLGRAITGGVGMGKAMKREHIYKKGQVSSTGKELVLKKEGSDQDLKVTFDNEQISKINEAGRKGGQKSANEALQEILKAKGVDEQHAKKTTLKSDVFGEGDGLFSKFKRYKKEVQGKSIYPEQSQDHLNFIRQKYGKWMDLENNGEGYTPKGVNLGVRDKLNKAKGFVFGDSEYDNYMRAHNQTPESRQTSTNPESSEARVSEPTENRRTTETNTKNPVETSKNTPETNVSETNVSENRPSESRPVTSESRPQEASPRETNQQQNSESNTKQTDNQTSTTEQLENSREKSDNARRGTNKNTENIQYTRKGIRKLIKSKTLDQKTTDALEKYINELKPKQKVSKKELKKILSKVQLQIPFSKQGSKLNKIIEYKRNIVKAEPGTKIDWFDEYQSRYPLKELGNINLKSRNQNADRSVLNRHNDDFSLRNAYAMNDYYIGENSNLVGKDIQDYINNSETQNFNTLQDLVNQYNSDAGRIRGTWDYGSNEVLHNHKANTQQGMSDHNRLFKRMFASRSQSNNNNALYNIGYQKNLEDIMGTSTWMRRMDQYKSEFDPTKEYKSGLDEEGYSRIHKVKLRNGTEGYVYKKANGDIGILDNDTARRMLGEQNPEINQQNPGAPTKIEGGNVPSGHKFDGGVDASGTARHTDYYQYLPTVLAGARMLGDINATNRRVRDYLGRLQVPLQQPWQFHRQVYGDYASLKEGENLAAQIRSNMNRPTTASSQLALLGRLEGERLASEQQWKGHIADNQMIHKTAEISANEQKENVKRATDVANTNRALMAEDARTRAGIIAAADTANHNSLDAWLMNYIEKPIQEEAYKRKAYQDYYDYLSMGPMEYDFTNDSYISDAQRRLNEIADDDPQRDEKRRAILKDVENYRIQRSNEYKLNQLRKFRRLNPYIQQRIPLEQYASYRTDGIKLPSTATNPYVVSAKATKGAKGGVLDSKYPTAVLRAKSKDNDRLIKEILEVIRNHKDLAKGVRMTDYSKYIIRDQK